MPVFRFKCDNCGLEKKRLVPKPTKYLCSACSTGEMIPQLPESIATVTKELRDKHRGVSLPKNQERMMKKRMNEHHDRHEIEQKIDEHGIDDARKFGWDKKVKRV